MDLHLNVFHPYNRDAGHEDQLTRAAMIVLRCVPLAHEALLGLVDCERLSSLPTPRFDMQTERLVLPGTEAEEQSIGELVSVFLGPHENLSDAAQVNVESERRARYDGVIQYGSRLLLVIESKLYEGAGDEQALEIPAGGLQLENVRKRVVVRWHELLDRWWNLTGLGVLGPAENAVLYDFFDFAEEHFGDLLPFTNLERCRENPRRWARRLRTILHTATGLGVESYGLENTVKFPETVTSVQRATIWFDESSVHMGMWPAELAAQYKSLYSDAAKVEALIAVGAQPGWQVSSNMHLSFFRARPHNRWYPRRHLDGPTYLKQWLADLPRAGRRPRSEIEDPAFAQWLMDRGYGEEADLATLKDWLANHQHDKFDIRPSVQIERSWETADAVALDRAGAFTAQVGDSIDQVLAALGEPALNQLVPDSIGS